MKKLLSIKLAMLLAVGCFCAMRAFAWGDPPPPPKPPPPVGGFTACVTLPDKTGCTAATDGKLCDYKLVKNTWVNATCQLLGAGSIETAGCGCN